MSFYNENVGFSIEGKKEYIYFEVDINYNNYKPPLKKNIHFKGYPDYFTLTGFLNVKDINKSTFECKEYPNQNADFLPQIFKYVVEIRNKNYDYVSFAFVVTIKNNSVQYNQIYVGCKSLNFFKINISKISQVLTKNFQDIKLISFGGIVCISDKTLHSYGSFQDYLYGTWNADFDDHKSLEIAILDSFGPYLLSNCIEHD
ncbi:hypothetical protein LDVICp071 [lymphocystis disease virus-China]|uniref:Uncharacterized protein n=2 Tax=Lymphocystis disease virus 2 TaxID=159183 RepID=A0A6F8X137_9VIRU|nr:hypothetical protein LDVICp071 [lymphocystis disease virus-China]AAU10917.1 hypothetical protein [lymphocystis disease virus-China]BCB67455.1 hypothetical protein [Lymphocystis disease virus 2]